MGEDEIAAVIEHLDGDREAQADERFGVWPENARALRVFLDSRRCWLFGAMGGVVGWNYPALESRARMTKTRDMQELLPLLEIMGDAALPLLNRKDDS